MFTGKPGLGQTEEHTYNVCECSGGFLNLQEEVVELPAAASCLTGRSGFAASLGLKRAGCLDVAICYLAESVIRTVIEKLVQTQFIS